MTTQPEREVETGEITSKRGGGEAAEYASDTLWLPP